MKIGAHVVLFRQKISSETDVILAGLSEAGFEGVEIGARFFRLEEKNRLMESLEKNNIQLSGLHTGAPFGTWAENGEAAVDMVIKTAEFLQGMPERNIIMSAMIPEGADIPAAARNMNEAALRCRDLGVKLHYHNHAHEFENNMEIFRILLEYAPSLLFGIDLGWVYKAGYEPTEVMKQYGDRIPYVHLRDARHRESREFAELGEGLFDYAALMSIQQNVLGSDGWAVVEYEEGPEDLERYRKARQFLYNMQ